VGRATSIPACRKPTPTGRFRLASQLTEAPGRRWAPARAVIRHEHSTGDDAPDLMLAHARHDPGWRIEPPRPPRRARPRTGRRPPDRSSSAPDDGFATTRSPRQTVSVDAFRHRAHAHPNARFLHFVEGAVPAREWGRRGLHWRRVHITHRCTGRHAEASGGTCRSTQQAVSSVLVEADAFARAHGAPADEMEWRRRDLDRQWGSWRTLGAEAPPPTRTSTSSRRTHPDRHRRRVPTGSSGCSATLGVDEQRVRWLPRFPRPSLPEYSRGVLRGRWRCARGSCHLRRSDPTSATWTTVRRQTSLGIRMPRTRNPRPS